MIFCIVTGGCEEAALAQQPADRDIFAAVLAGIADPHHAAVGQPQPPRALDLEEEEVDRIGRPGDLQPAPGQRALLDLAALVIEDVMRRSRRAGRGRARRSADWLEQVGRLARRPAPRSPAARVARARDLGLVIAGGEGAAVADDRRLEMGGEEGRSVGARPGRRRRRRRAPVAGPGQPADASWRRTSDGTGDPEGAQARGRRVGGIERAAAAARRAPRPRARWRAAAAWRRAADRRRRRSRRRAPARAAARAPARASRRGGGITPRAARPARAAAGEEQEERWRGKAPSSGGFVGLDEQPVGVLAAQGRAGRSRCRWSAPRRSSSRRPARRPCRG